MSGYWNDLVEPLLARRWILCTDVLAPLGPMLERLRDLGAPRPFVIAGSAGTGDLPAGDLAEVALLGTSGATIMQGLRAYHDALRHLPGEVIDRIEAWDPHSEARVLSSWLDTDITIAGRPSWGGTPGTWKALEDKTTVDALWDAAGVRRAPSEVVPARAGALLAAAAALDEGSGTVWAGDNTEGWHGGAEYLRWVRDPGAATDDVAFFEQRCTSVRVMPFLPGIPCSIHGMVFPDTVVAFRPVEMLVLRTGGSSLRYAGTATTWDPPPGDRDHMRSTARRVGRHLRDLVDFRGAFTVDGVVTGRGFLPTELNPRPGGGLGAVARGADMAPLVTIHRALVAGEDLGYRPAELERTVVAGADRNRTARALLPVARPIVESREATITVADGDVRFAGDGDADADADGTITLGPSAQGGLVIVSVESGVIPAGASFAPTATRALSLADATWDLGIGSLTPAEPA